MDCLEGDVPVEWIKRCLIGKDLLPFCIRKEGTPFVIPLNKNGHWASDRHTVSYWENASSFYTAHRGSGKHTPATLERRLDHHNALLAQSKNSNPFVVYNTSGSRVYAAVVNHNVLIDSSLYSVACNTLDEANFLTGILNSDVLQTALAESKMASRHYHTYFWNVIPIPLFNRHNTDHQVVALMADASTTLAHKMLKKHETIHRKALLKEIRDSGSLKKIDAAIAKILPNYITTG